MHRYYTYLKQSAWEWHIDPKSSTQLSWSLADVSIPYVNIPINFDRYCTSTHTHTHTHTYPFIFLKACLIVLNRWYQLLTAKNCLSRFNIFIYLAHSFFFTFRSLFLYHFVLYFTFFYLCRLSISFLSFFLSFFPLSLLPSLLSLSHFAVHIKWFFYPSFSVSLNLFSLFFFSFLSLPSLFYFNLSLFLYSIHLSHDYSFSLSLSLSVQLNNGFHFFSVSTYCHYPVAHFSYFVFLFFLSFYADGKVSTGRPDTADLEVQKIQSGSPCPSLAVTEGDYGELPLSTSRSTLQR